MLRLSLNRVHNTPTKHDMTFIFGSIIAIILLGLGWASMQPSTTISAPTTSTPLYTVSSRVNLTEPPQVVAVETNSSDWKDAVRAQYICVDEDGVMADTNSLIHNCIVPGLKRHCAGITVFKVYGNAAVVLYKLLDNFTELHGTHEVCEETLRYVIDVWILTGSTLKPQRIHDHHDDMLLDRVAGINRFGGNWKGRSRPLDNITVDRNGVHFTFDGEDKHFPIS